MHNPCKPANIPMLLRSIAILRYYTRRQFLNTLSPSELKPGMRSSASHSNFGLGQAEDPQEVLCTRCKWEMLCPYQIPLASGQSRAIPAHVSKGDTGLSNRKWSCRPKGQSRKEKLMRSDNNSKCRVSKFQLTNGG